MEPIQKGGIFMKQLLQKVWVALKVAGCVLLLGWSEQDFGMTSEGRK